MNEPEEFKDLIDSRGLSKEENKVEREIILKGREERFKKRSIEEHRMLRLMPLKYQMEDYLQ